MLALAALVSNAAGKIQSIESQGRNMGDWYVRMRKLDEGIDIFSDVSRAGEARDMNRVSSDRGRKWRADCGLRVFSLLSAED